MDTSTKKAVLTNWPVVIQIVYMRKSPFYGLVGYTDLIKPKIGDFLLFISVFC